MSRKIIGVTVGSPHPKPNLMQTDPTKGDYVKGKEEFLEQFGSGSGGNVDLTGYATEQWVQDQKYLTAVPDGYAKTADIPTKVSELDNDSGYLTEHQSLDGYALKSEIPSVPVKSVNGKTGAVSLTAADVKARPDSWMPTASDVGALPSSTVIPTVPTKVSAFTNDAGYLTEHQDLSEYAKKTEIPSVPAWAKAASKPSYSKSEVGLGNVDNVRQYSASNPPPYPVTSVNGKTGDVTITVPTKVSAFENDKGYLTQHQDISGKVDKNKLTLGVHTDGLIYVFVDGQPVGNGVELPTGGIDGYVDSDKNIVVRGLTDGTYKFFFELENGSLVEGGNLVLDTNVYYTVTNNLTQCTNSNSATQAIGGQSYSATITAESGFELKSVTVTMGGSPVTVSGGTISIASVTGNIVITAVAEEIKASYTNLFKPDKATINNRLNSSADVTAQDGYFITNTIDVSDKTPFTANTKIYVKSAILNDDGKSRIFTYLNTGTEYTGMQSSVQTKSTTITDEGNGVLSMSGLAAAFGSGTKRFVMCLKVSDTAITESDIQNFVITIDEPIV